MKKFKKKTRVMQVRQSTIDFGDALRALKRGELVSRLGWNAKGMYLYLATDLVSRVNLRPGIRFEPCIVMFTAQKKHQPGWLASQADMLAEDWTTVRP